MWPVDKRRWIVGHSRDLAHVKRLSVIGNRLSVIGYRLILCISWELCVLSLKETSLKDLCMRVYILARCRSIIRNISKLHL